MTVVILEDAAEDLESGAQFYQSCAAGVGDYFLDSILSDLDSLVLFAGVHPIYFGFHRMLSKRFPFGIYSLNSSLNDGVRKLMASRTGIEPVSPP